MRADNRMTERRRGDTCVRFCQYNEDKRTAMKTWERGTQRKAGEELVKLGRAHGDGEGLLDARERMYIGRKGGRLYLNWENMCKRRIAEDIGQLKKR